MRVVSLLVDRGIIATAGIPWGNITLRLVYICNQLSLGVSSLSAQCFSCRLN